MPAFTIRNIDDDSIVTWADSWGEAIYIADEIESGRWDNNPRMTYIVEE